MYVYHTYMRYDAIHMQVDNLKVHKIMKEYFSYVIDTLCE